MNVGQIEYTIDAKTSPYLKQVDSVKRQNTNLGKSFDGVDKNVGRMNASFGHAAGGLNKLSVAVGRSLGPVGMMTAAIGAATAATMAFTVSAVSAVKEIDVLATRANTNTSSFQAWAYAATTVNVSMDNLSQTIQDTNDRIGEFTGEGVGELDHAFKKFLQPAGLTVEKLREMAGQDVLQAVVNAMEDAGASGNEMTAVLEMIASNASHLLPLLQDNGKAVKELSKEAEDMGLIISNEQIHQAKEFDRQWKLLGGQVTNFKNIVAIGLTPAMQEFVGWTRTAVKWLDEFFNVSDAAKAKDLTEEIGDLQAAILERNLRNAKKYGGVSVFDALNPFSTDSGDTGAMTSELNKKLAQLDELKNRMNKVREEIANPKMGVSAGSGSEFSPYELPGPLQPKAGKQDKFSGKDFMSGFGGQMETGDSFATGISAGIAADNETLVEELTRQRELLLEFQELEIGDAQAHAEALSAIDKRLAEEKRKNDSAMLSASSDFFGASADLIGTFGSQSSKAYKAIFAVSKGFAIANAALQMQTAIANASALPFPANLPAIAQAVSLGASIASNIGSLTYGGGRETGGSVSSGSFYQMGEGNKPEVLQTSQGLFGIPGDNGKVFNQSQLEQINGGGSGGGITVIVNNAPEGTQVTQSGNDVIIDLATKRSQDNFVQQMDSKQGPMFSAITRNTNAKTKL